MGIKAVKELRLKLLMIGQRLRVGEYKYGGKEPVEERADYMRDMPRIFTMSNIDKGLVLPNLHKPHRVLPRCHSQAAGYENCDLGYYLLNQSK